MERSIGRAQYFAFAAIGAPAVSWGASLALNHFNRRLMDGSSHPLLAVAILFGFAAGTAWLAGRRLQRTPKDTAIGTILAGVVAVGALVFLVFLYFATAPDGAFPN